MGTLVKLAPIIDPETGEDIAWRLEMLELHWGCLTESAPLPKLTRAPYKAPSYLWDHDHCDLCWAKFMEDDRNETLREGWIINDPGNISDPEAEAMRELPESRVLYAPKSAKDWMCDMCHRIVTTWASGGYEVRILAKKTIPESTP